MWFLLFLFYHFEQKLFIYLLNFFHSCDSQTVGLICVNLLIDFDASCKRTKCDVPKTSISRHNIYLVIYWIRVDVLMWATSRVLWITRHLSYVIQFTLIVLIFSLICNLEFGGLAYHRPRPTRKTTFPPCNFVTLEYGGLALAKSVLYSKFQHVTVTIIDALP